VIHDDCENKKEQVQDKTGRTTTIIRTKPKTRTTKTTTSNRKTKKTKEQELEE